MSEKRPGSQSCEAETHAKRVSRVFGSLDHILDSSGVRQPSTPCTPCSRDQLQDPNKVEFDPSKSLSRRASCGFLSGAKDCGPKNPSHWPKASSKRGYQRMSSRRTPDYVKHPERWVKYDLKEDGTEKMKGLSADQVNKAAALEFLQTRSCSGNTEVEHETSECGATGKLMFKKPKNRVRQKQTECYSETDPSTPPLNRPRNNVHVMKEYRVGARREEKLKRTRPALELNSSVRLTHLEEDSTDESCG